MLMQSRFQKVIALIVVVALNIGLVAAQNKDAALRIVFVRHGEKPKKGNNLTCEGFNRSLQLPNVLVTKFGVPNAVFVPALGLGEATKHSRMFETVIPLAVKYNLSLNTAFEEKDFDKLAVSLKQEKGTVLVSWEHKAISGIVKSLGISQELVWDDEDYDSIWIITFNNGVPTFTKDNENIKPSNVCPF